MRKTILMGLLVVAVMLASVPAFAFDLGGYLGPIELKLFDWTIGRQYTFNPASGQFDPEGARAGMLGGGQSLTPGLLAAADGVVDSWTILNITQIVDPNGSPLWNSGQGGEYLTAYLYGFDDVYINPITGGIQIGSSGGQVTVFLDTVNNFNANAADPNVVGLPVIGSDPWGATDGSVFLTANFVPGIVPLLPTVTRWETVDGLTLPFSGNGSGYLAVTGGSHQSLFDGNGFLGGNADMHAIFDFSDIGRNNFDSKSSDPVRGHAIPEPASMLLFGTGLFGLVGAGLRRKSA